LEHLRGEFALFRVFAFVLNHAVLHRTGVVDGDVIKTVQQGLHGGLHLRVVVGRRRRREGE